MSEPPTGVGRVARLASQVEDDAMPDACGRPPPFPVNSSLGSESSGYPYQNTRGGEAVLRGTGQVYETSEGSSGGSQQIPSGRRQDSSAQISQSCPSDSALFNKFLENYTFFFRYSISDRLEFKKRLQLVMKHFERLPDNLKASYYDVMVLYSEDDRSDAEAYCQSLNDLSLENGKRVKAVLYDVMDFANAKRRMFGSLEIAFERCTFAFVYLTKQFCKCEWSQIASEECLMEAIYNKDKRWCVVPVYTVQRTKADFRIPMGLNSLKGVNFYNNDDFYRRGLQSLIGGKIYRREDNEENLFFKQYKVAIEMERKMQMEEQQNRQKLVKYEQVYPPPSSSEKEDSSESFKDLDIQTQNDDDSGVFAAERFTPKADLHRSSSNSVGGLGFLGSQGDTSASLMSYSIDAQGSVTGDSSQDKDDSSLQADMAFSHQSQTPQMNPGMRGKEAMATKYLSESEKFDKVTGEKPSFDKDEKVVVHHIHTHTHIYADKEPEKSKKSVVNIYGAENVMIGDNTVVEGGAQLSPDPSDKGPEMSTKPTKKPDCNREESPSMSSQQSMEGRNRQSMEGPSRQSMKGPNRQSMEAPNRQSMEGPSRQSIDGHPSSLPSESQDTTTKKMPRSPVDDTVGNVETDEKEAPMSSTRQFSPLASKYYKAENTAAPASLPLTSGTSTAQSTKVAPNVPSTNVASNVPSTNVASNVTSTNVASHVPSPNVASNVSSTNVASNVPSTIVASNVSSTNVTVNIPSKKVGESVSTGNNTHNQTMKSMENVSGTTLSATTASSSHINSELSRPGTLDPNISGASNIQAGSVEPNISPKPKRNPPKVTLPKRPIIFADPASRAKPQAMAKVMPLQNQQTNSSSDDEFRNDFGNSLARPECQAVNQTEQKEVYQGHNTQVKTAVGSDRNDEDETEMKQVASVYPQSRVDLEPDCSNDTETCLKSYSGVGLTETDQDDQAVSKVIEMGFLEMDIKAALMSLQNRAPGRRHFSVPNLLDEMEKLQQRPASQTSQRSSDLDIDGPSEAGFVVLNEESSRQHRPAGHQGSNQSTNSASRHNRGSPNPEDSPRSNVSSPSSGSPSTKLDKDKCRIS